MLRPESYTPAAMHARYKILTHVKSKKFNLCCFSMHSKHNSNLSRQLLFKKGNGRVEGCSTKVMKGVGGVQQEYWRGCHGIPNMERNVIHVYPSSCLEGLIQKNQNLTNTITSHSINNSKLFHLHF